MKNKKTFRIIIALASIIVLLGALAVYLVFNSLDPITSESETVVFEVPDSAASKDVFIKLGDEGIIKNGNIAYYYCRLFHKSSFYAGSYEIDKNWPVLEIVDYLSDQSNAIQNTVSITFVEGEWLKHYAAKLAEVTDVSEEELLAYWNDEDVVRSLMNDYPFLTEEIFSDDARYLLEGYLFPDTYEFYRETDVETITRTFLDRTLSFYNEHLADFEKASLSVHEIFTLASIVQYESSSFEDMQNIAGVFYNRLRDNMPLGSSVTVCYAIDLEKSDSWKECEYNADYDSPYNTYLYAGLPPTPIVNPGANALIATLEPADNDYYYFMADVCGDGTVYYAKTYSEHQANVDRYLTCY